MTEVNHTRCQMVVVIGAGVMGSGVAQLFAEHGCQVLLIDKDARQLDVAKQKIQQRLHFVSLSHIRHLHSTESEILDQIKTSTDSTIPVDAKLVVENITENYLLKKELYKKNGLLHELACPVCINTSAIPVAKLAKLVLHPDRVMGAHFMNPAPDMPMVELIRTKMTSQQTVDDVEALLGGVGRQTVVVNDSPGFVTNRAMMLFVNEAIQILHEGVSAIDSIDRLFKQCFGHKMGPLQTADLIGLDTVLYSLEVIYEERSDVKFQPCELLRVMVDEGKLGVKSGQGFYEYV